MIMIIDISITLFLIKCAFKLVVKTGFVIDVY